MATPVYTVSFVQAAAVEGEEMITVPDGFVYVLRDVDVWCDEAASGYLILLRGYNDQNIWGHFGSSDPASNSGSWRGRLAFTPGQTFGVAVASGSWDVSMGGYKLGFP